MNFQSRSWARRAGWHRIMDWGLSRPRGEREEQGVRIQLASRQQPQQHRQCNTIDSHSKGSQMAVLGDSQDSQSYVTYTVCHLPCNPAGQPSHSVAGPSLR